MKRRRRRGVDFWAVYEEDAWVGIAYVISGEHLAYLFYLAMNPDCRGKGCGSDTLQALKRRYADKNLLIAIEQLEEDAPNYEERVRRKQFYKKNGLMELHCKIREAKMIYEALGTGETVSPQEYREIMHGYLGPVFKHLISTEIME